jgi:hypothetical protein
MCLYLTEKKIYFTFEIFFPLDLDPHLSKSLDPDPHIMNADPNSTSMRTQSFPALPHERPDHSKHAAACLPPKWGARQ